MLRILLLSTLVAVIAQNQPTPQAAVDQLLATDRAFAAAAAGTTAIPALTAMFTDDVVMPLPTFDFAQSKASALNALGANPDNAEGRLEWEPIRGGVSADGLHGFTLGYMTLKRPDGTRVPIKYLAYWLKRPEGWRVAVYKRGRAGEGDAPRDLMPAALPDRMVPPSTDAAAIARHKESLAQAERAFSDEAQAIGIGPAFARHGSADAVNMGPATAPGFVVGADAIGRGIGAASSPATPGSPVSWAPDRGAIVASSGDLGVTFGMIRQNKPVAPGRPAATPFITVWRRASPGDPWRYVAE